MASLVDRIVQQQSLNFYVTNRIPRRAATRIMAWFSHIESPLLTRVSLGLWQLFGGPLALHESKQQTFSSLHQCFVRELRDGVRPLDPRPEVIVSPCDAIVGETGAITAGQLFQAKGISYRLDDLVLDPAVAQRHEGGVYVTLRLQSTMYHRFHAPGDGAIDQVMYVPGDTWNVNPITLRRMPRVFCMNERVVIPVGLRDTRAAVTLVPVAAILVGGIHLRWSALTFNLKSPGPRRISCPTTVRKGEELGHFLHGSTIVVLGTPGLSLDPSLEVGRTIRMGEALFLNRRGCETRRVDGAVTGA